jgi:hypothetical protein
MSSTVWVSVVMMLKSREALHAPQMGLQCIGRVYGFPCAASGAVVLVRAHGEMPSSLA